MPPIGLIAAVHNRPAPSTGDGGRQGGSQERQIRDRENRGEKGRMMAGDRAGKQGGAEGGGEACGGRHKEEWDSKKIGWADEGCCEVGREGGRQIL